MSDAIGGARLVTVFGGTGFIGRSVVQALAKRNWRVRVAVRRPNLTGDSRVLRFPGQILPIQANLRVPWSVERAVEGADAVVNLVGILAPSGRQTFGAVQAEGPRIVAEAARARGLASIVHVSAIGADAGSSIPYLRSKGQGERGLLDAAPEAVVLRPSIVFGPEDSFFNRFAGMATIAPALPLIGGGGTRFQPVFVADVAEAVARALEGKARPGAIYELGGPEVLTFRECLERVLRVTGRKRLLLPLPFGLARALGTVLGVLPGAPLTADQVRMLEIDNVVSAEAKAEGRTIEGLGIEPMGVDAILPTYLVRFRQHGQFTRPTAP